MKSNYPKIAVFDVCDTLYYSNTTHDFVGYVFSQNTFNSRSIIYQLVNNRYSPLRYALILIYVLTRFDAHKKINLWLLRDLCETELSDFSKKFVREFLSKKTIAQTHSLMEKCKKEGLSIVLCSSSIEPVVTAIAAEVKADEIVCTSLGFKEGIFTGKISEDITDKKIKFLRMKGFLGEIEYAVSDNLGDLDLLKAAKNSFAVTYKNKNRDFWQRNFIKVIDLR